MIIFICLVVSYGAHINKQWFYFKNLTEADMFQTAMESSRLKPKIGNGAAIECWEASENGTQIKNLKEIE